MSVKTIAIVYYSGSGNTEKMAYTIAEVLTLHSIDVKVERAEKFDISCLTKFDGIVMGSPTYFSNVAWPIKKLIDESIGYYYDGKKLKGKLAGIFTSAGNARDAKDCLKMLEIALGFHHQMKVIEGILRVKSDSDEEVKKRCEEYGRKLVEEIKKV